MSHRFAKPWIVAVASVALAAAVVLPFLAWDSAPPELLTALALLIAGAAAFAGGPVPGVVALLAGLGCVAIVVDRPGRVALALPAGAAMVIAAGLLGTRARRRERERVSVLSELGAIRESAAEAIVDVDEAGSITSWSRGAEEIYGYSADDVEGRRLSVLTVDEQADEIDDLLEQVRDGTLVTKHVLQQRADGKTFMASLTLAPVGNGVNGSHGAVAIAADVSERSRAIRRAKEADAKYEALVNRLPLVTFLYDARDRSSPVYVSPQIEGLLGYPPEQWLRDPELHSRLLHPDDRARVLEEAAKAAASDAPLRTEYRMVTRAGDVVWIREEAATVRDDEGNPAYIQGYLLDFSDEKLGQEHVEHVREAERQALAQAAEREERLNFLARATDVLALSGAYEQALRQIAELVVRRFADWCIFDIGGETGELTRRVVVHAEPLPASQAAQRSPQDEPDEVARQVVARRRAAIVPAPDSAPETAPSVSGLDVESYVCVPLLVRERVVGAMTMISTTAGRRFTAADLALARDVARRAALAIDNARLYAEVEERAEAARVLTYVADGVFLLDRAGAVQLWNPAAEKMTGLAANAVFQRPAADVLPNWQEIVERIPIESSPDPGREETVPFDTPKGERWFSIVGVNFFGGTVYAFRDVTEARRLDELKSEFVATASHELRTPLAAVYGAAQTLRRHDFALDEAGRARFISMITDESERLSRIVNEILLASQLDAGRLDVTSEPFDPAELMQRVVDTTRTHLPPTVTLDTALPDEAPPSVAADRDKARQVLVNLVDNAIKYSPDGGRVEVAIDRTQTTVRFHVSDEGLGIPPDEQERIFDKFYRLDPEMTRGVGGTGLGLYICSELVRRMDGRIWVESNHGQGSTFSFELPVAEPELSTVVAPEVREPAETSAPAPTSEV